MNSPVTMRFARSASRADPGWFEVIGSGGEMAAVDAGGESP